MAVETPAVKIGWRAPDFELLGADGKRHTLQELKGDAGTIVMFICNHCPYVKSATDRLVRDMAALSEKGIKAIAINSNDATTYPEDSFENMKVFAEENDFNFPYLCDETQEIAKTYGAVCTPDFFGFNGDLELQYRGRLDSNRKIVEDPSARRELLEAMLLVAETGKGPEEQIPSMGCSIKWRDE